MKRVSDWLPSDESLREGLKDHLLSRPQSISQLAKSIGLCLRTVSEFLKGNKTLKLSSRIKMKRFLGND